SSGSTRFDVGSTRWRNGSTGPCGNGSTRWRWTTSEPTRGRRPRGVEVDHGQHVEQRSRRRRVDAGRSAGRAGRWPRTGAGATGRADVARREAGRCGRVPGVTTAQTTEKNGIINKGGARVKPVIDVEGFSFVEDIPA